MSTRTLSAVLNSTRRSPTRGPDGGPADCELLRAFVDTANPAAFEALVCRHGPMVFRLCRRLLGNAPDADDAFQATFLLLARRAGSIRNAQSLAGWLHGVAYRMAADTRRAASRRRKYEGRVAPAPPTDPAVAAACREIQAALEEEIGALPPADREPFVLCCLEHLGAAEAAVRLGLTESAVRGRLARARKRLGQRLARRGVSLTAALATVVLSGGGAPAAVPPVLLSATATAAGEIAAGCSLKGVSASAGVIGLVERGSKAIAATRTKVLALLLAAAVLAGGVVLSARPPADDPAPARPADPPSAAGPQP